MPTLDDIDWPVTTERLLLRRATEPDVKPTWEYRRAEQVSRWISTWSRSLEEYAETFLDPTRLARTVIVELDGQVIGDAAIVIQSPWSQTEVADRAKHVEAELGWTFDPAYGGQGYATETVRALIELSFTRLGLRRVVANCFADNAPSWRLMERVGMRREVHTVKESLHRDGRWLDGLGYALLAEEWPPG
ncbi:MAG: GNAT family N-acetyltransferase [Nocardioidaceae bacterium]|nr:GNAT family N-acetyltransferase [Nocardioidaceae bacterium]